MDFVVIDTEGKPELSEIAVLDSQGQLIYELFRLSTPLTATSKAAPDLSKQFFKTLPT